MNLVNLVRFLGGIHTRKYLEGTRNRIWNDISKIGISTLMTWTGSEPPICYPVHHYVRQWAKVYVTDKTKDEKCYVIDVMQISIVEKSWFAIFFYHYFSSGGKGPQVALLHPRLLAVYSITRSNSKEKTTLESYQMNLVYQHKLTRSAYSMCTGKLKNNELGEIRWLSYKHHVNFLSL